MLTEKSLKVLRYVMEKSKINIPLILNTYFQEDALMTVKDIQRIVGALKNIKLIRYKDKQMGYILTQAGWRELNDQTNQ